MTNWAGFVKWAIAAFGGALFLACAAIIIFDPYHNNPWSPHLERDMMDSNQRYLYPSLARDTSFDSAVFGTSSLRLLNPEILDEGFDARFAMLALNAGTPWEQSRLLDLYLRKHESPRVIILGIDLAWCLPNTDYEGQTNRLFPEWVYDDNPYNDLLYLLNGTSLEVSLRQLGRYLHMEEPRYGRDGYSNFLPPRAEYDLAKARINIYEQEEPIEFSQAVDRSAGGAPYRFPVHELYREMLGSIPQKTKLIVMFPPHHYYYYLTNRTRIDACRSDVERLTREIRPQAVMLDLMFASSITTQDENYWDHIHYDASIGDELAASIAAVVERGEAVPYIYRVR